MRPRIKPRGRRCVPHRTRLLLAAVPASCPSRGAAQQSPGVELPEIRVRPGEGWCPTRDDPGARALRVALRVRFEAATDTATVAAALRGSTAALAAGQVEPRDSIPRGGAGRGARLERDRRGTERSGAAADLAPARRTGGWRARNERAVAPRVARPHRARRVRASFRPPRERGRRCGGRVRAVGVPAPRGRAGLPFRGTPLRPAQPVSDGGERPGRAGDPVLHRAAAGDPPSRGRSG